MINRVSVPDAPFFSTEDLQVEIQLFIAVLFYYSIICFTSFPVHLILKLQSVCNLSLVDFLCILVFLCPGESSHLALNKLKCPHCNYIAKHRRTLKRHLIIHSGVRSFSCDICGKLFTRREHVKRHSLVSPHMHTNLSFHHCVMSIFQVLPNTTAFWPCSLHSTPPCVVSGSFALGSESTSRNFWPWYLGFNAGNRVGSLTEWYKNG